MILICQAQKSVTYVILMSHTTPRGRISGVTLWSVSSVIYLQPRITDWGYSVCQHQSCLDFRGTPQIIRERIGEGVRLPLDFLDKKKLKIPQRLPRAGLSGATKAEHLQSFMLSRGHSEKIFFRGGS